VDSQENLEQLQQQQPGDKVFRLKRRRPRRRLRITPDIPGVFRFIRRIATETPLIPLILALVGLWLLFSWGVHLAEREVGGQITSYGHALWWTFAAMHTQGANSPGPVTALGIGIGSVWSILSTVAFFGAIIGTLYAYFMLPRRRPSREIVGALQYNLEQMEKLSVDELELLRDTTVRIVNSRIKEMRNNEPSGK